jgi:hypothetical protein
MSFWLYIGTITDTRGFFSFSLEFVSIKEHLEGEDGFRYNAHPTKYITIEKVIKNPE